MGLFIVHLIGWAHTPKGPCVMTYSIRFPVRPARGFTLVERLVVIAIIGILVALLLPAIQAAREAARRAQCQSQLHNAALAVLNYESARKMLPNGMNVPNPGAKIHLAQVSPDPTLGPNWIIAVLPYMEEQGLRDSFDPKSLVAPYTLSIADPTTTGLNYKARGVEIPALLCPSDSPNNRIKFEAFGGNWARGNYAASAGRAFIWQPSTAVPSMDGTLTGTDAWTNKDNTNGYSYPCERGVMGPNVAVSLRQITDGTSKTIMLGEIRAGISPQDGRGCWALGHAGASLIARYGGGSDSDGPNADFANSDDVYCVGCGDAGGAGSTCGPRTNGATIAEKMSAQEGVGFDAATIRSRHPGGAHVAYSDGSVDFINDDIETTGCYNLSAPCCTAWDYMILSTDEGRLGAYNGAPTGRGAGAPCK
jgi:prepilin-type N-terminal cleavage/methylation domain-containing protein/prepilin-type processing-associated H-X9-DG protein